MLVKIILPYWIKVSCPHFKKDVKLERVQKRTIKMIQRLEKMPYSERL